MTQVIAYGWCREEHRQSIVGPARERQRHLLIVQQSHGRMIERTFAPFARQNPLCLPAALEVGASNSQFVYEPANIRIVGVACHRGAEQRAGATTNASKTSTQIAACPNGMLPTYDAPVSTVRPLHHPRPRRQRRRNAHGRVLGKRRRLGSVPADWPAFSFNHQLHNCGKCCFIVALFGERTGPLAIT